MNITETKEWLRLKLEKLDNEEHKYPNTTNLTDQKVFQYLQLNKLHANLNYITAFRGTDCMFHNARFHNLSSVFS